MNNEFILNYSEPFAIFENQIDLEMEFPIDLFCLYQQEFKTYIENEVPLILKKVQDLSQQGYYMVGYLSYESFFNSQKFNLSNAGLMNKIEKLPLIHFMAFQKRISLSRNDFETLKIVDQNNEFNSNTNKPLGIFEIKLNETFESYERKINQIKVHQREGDTYQVNFTMKNRFKWTGHPLKLFFELRKYQNVKCAAFLHLGEGVDICSYSPELFFSKVESTILTKPMKGTATKGKDFLEENKIKEAMLADPKTRAENLMIVDLIRNDLGRVAQPGSVKVSKLFEIETYSTLHQMTSTIEAKIDHSIELVDIMKALFPCGSVTGAPKKRTMEIISTLESEPRGLYTGALGYLMPSKNLKSYDAYFNVSIRTLILKSGSGIVNEGEMGIGSGIVYDSHVNEEWKECLLKRKFLNQINSTFKLIETFKYDSKSNSYIRIDMHLKRLCKCALELGFDLSIDELKFSLEKTKNNLIKLDKEKDYRIRIELNQNGIFEIEYSPLVNEDAFYRVIFCKTPIQSQLFFQKYKTTVRNFYDQNYKKAKTLGFDEIIFINENGNIVEGSRHNIFYLKENQGLTPPISDGALPGILREEILQSNKLFINNIDFNIKEDHIPFVELWSVAQNNINNSREFKKNSSLFLGNSLRGLHEARLFPYWIEDLSLEKCSLSNSLKGSSDE